MMSDVFTEKLELGHEEVAVKTSYSEFKKVITSRRSIRVFTSEQLDESIILNALDDALIAPNSSNLQAWEFIWVREKSKKDELARYCFSQNGAKTASDLIICIARTDTWKKHCQDMISSMKKEGTEVPKVVLDYYGKIAPMAYGLIGPYGIFSPFKWVLLNSIGMFKVMAREPVWPSQLKTWAIKSCALACENIMLSLRAQGADSIPMEGFDSKRVKKMFGLNRHQHITMIIGAGKRASDGVYGPQMRFEKDRFIKVYK